LAVIPFNQGIKYVLHDAETNHGVFGLRILTAEKLGVTLTCFLRSAAVGMGHNWAGSILRQPNMMGKSGDAKVTIQRTLSAAMLPL